MNSPIKIMWCIATSMLLLLVAGQNAWARLNGEITFKGNCLYVNNQYKCNFIVKVGNFTAYAQTNIDKPSNSITFNNETFEAGEVIVCINGTIWLPLVDNINDIRNVQAGKDVTISLRQGTNSNIWFYEAIAYKNEHLSCKAYSVSEDCHEISVLLTEHPDVGFDRVLYKYVRTAPFSAQNTIISGINDTYINDGVNCPVPTVTYTTGNHNYTLTHGTDYSLSYSNIDGPGKARVTVTGIGEYEGSRYVEYNIRNINFNDFTQNSDGSYRIASKDDFAKLSRLVNTAGEDCANKTFRQEGDITCDNTYVPIGTDACAFCGTYDGGGNSIDGIIVSGSDDYVGLFGIIGTGGTVKDVILLTSSFEGASWVGGIAGKNSGTVLNCHIQNSVIINTGCNGSWDHGGVVGLNSGTITGCLCAASINDNNCTNCKEYGGIAGASSDGAIEDCIYTGSTISAASSKGAVVGNVSNTTLTNNYYTTIDLGGVNRNDVSGAVFAHTYNFMPTGIGAQTASYSCGLTAYEHGLSYQGIYYTHNVSLTLVQRTKDDVPLWWSTFYSASINYSLGEGATAYTMGTDYKLYRLGNNGATIPKGVAVIIIATKADAALIPLGSGDLSVTDHAVGGNLLRGSDTSVSTSDIAGTPYVLGEVNHIFGFHPFTGAEIPANKAYYVVE